MRKRHTFTLMCHILLLQQQTAVQVRLTTDKPQTNDLSQQHPICYLSLVQHLICSIILVFWIRLNSFVYMPLMESRFKPGMKQLSFAISQKSSLGQNETGRQHMDGLESSHRIPWPLTSQTANGLHRPGNKTCFFWLNGPLLCPHSTDKHWINTQLCSPAHSYTPSLPFLTSYSPFFSLPPSLLDSLWMSE